MHPVQQVNEMLDEINEMLDEVVVAVAPGATARNII